MHIESLVVGPLESNCYIITCPESQDVMIVDPGGDAPSILEALRRADRNASPRWLVNTHGHGDHIGANAELKKAFPNMRIAIHVDDAPALTSPAINLSPFVGLSVRSPGADVELKEGDTIDLGKERFAVIHTPGHTPGGICLYRAARQPGETPLLFSGDTLFAQSIGRGDLPGGDMDLLLRSIAEKLMPLPDSCIVYPGHGPTTTIGDERRLNPFLPHPR
jgi:glyoxylase-like metal-dependent hydrolase (beta-lactamase superfamily II)